MSNICTAYRKVIMIKPVLLLLSAYPINTQQLI